MFTTNPHPSPQHMQWLVALHHMPTSVTALSCLSSLDSHRPSAGWLPQQLQQQLRSCSVVSGEDSHDDFKPKYKQEPVGEGDVDAVIKQDINSNKVFIYMKVRCSSIG
jgi:hypothetical protein